MKHGAEGNLTRGRHAFDCTSLLLRFDDQEGGKLEVQVAEVRDGGTVWRACKRRHSWKALTRQFCSEPGLVEAATQLVYEPPLQLLRG